jgi:branched-subunit amino acid transport protein
MKGNIYVYIIVMAFVTYLIRAIPLTLIYKEIKNVYVKSFLYYVPYATLAAMTFPVILFSTASMISAIIGFVVALILAYKGKSLIMVAICSCVVVFLVERVMQFIA